MPYDLDRANRRYLQQAGWTAAIRQRAFSFFGLHGLRRILEVGSGTGAITAELRQASPGAVIGLDLDMRANVYARTSDPRLTCVTGRGEELPFPSASFDLACCHFLLLWVADPLAVVREMMRVTKPGGGVLCLAEPDYGGRIDHPESLAQLGTLQEGALRSEGADTRLGRRLRLLLHQAGLLDVCAGVLGGEWSDNDPATRADQELDWQTTADDLADHVSKAELRAMQSEAASASREKSRVVFVPTFYAWGTRPPLNHHSQPSPRQTG